MINALFKYLEKILSVPRDLISGLDDEENAIIDE